MKTKILLFALILTLGFIQACNNSTENKPTNLVISGQVFNSDNNAGIEGALITTVPATTTQLTDGNGKFVINVDSAGTYQVIAKKTGYSTGSASVKVAPNLQPQALLFMRDVKAINKPPNKPDYSEPKYDDSCQVMSTDLTWTCSDPDGNSLKYDVYFGTDNPPSNIVASDISATSYQVKNLQKNTTYYWKVVAKDEYEWTDGDIWRFHTYKTEFNMSNLIAYYPFNGDAKDYGTNKLDGILNGVTFTEDRNNNKNSAAYFDGYSSYINVPYSPALDFGSNLTVACWIKPVSGFGTPLSGYIFLLSRWLDQGYMGSSYFFSLLTSGQVFVAIYDNNTNYNVQTQGFISPNQWTHIAWTYSDGMTKLYINGKLDFTRATGAPQKSKYDLLIGKYKGGSANYGGAIDDIYLFNRTLSDAEIQILAKQ